MAHNASPGGTGQTTADVGKESSPEVFSSQTKYQDKADAELYFEEILEKLGNFGKFQFIQCLLCASQLLRACFMGLGFAFIGYTPPHSCREVNETQLLVTSQSVLLQNASSLTAANFDVTYGQCDITVSSNQNGDGVWTKVMTLECPNGRHFPQGRQTTMVSEWDLVCEKTGQVETVMLVFNLGTLIGGFVVPPIADRYGRKPVLCVSAFLSTCLEFATAFASNLFVALAFLFINGVVVSGHNCTYFTLGVEMLIARHRQLLGIAFSFCWMFFSLIVGLTAYLLEDVGWRYFQAIGALTGLVSLVLPVFLYESPRWLMINGRRRKALAILKKASEQNGANFEDVKLACDRYTTSLFPADDEKDMLNNGLKGEWNDVGADAKSTLNDASPILGQDCPPIEVERYTLLSMLKRKDLCILLLTAWYMWTMSLLLDYGLYLSASYLAGNRFLNFAIMVLIEIPAYFVIMYMLDKMGRLAVLRIFLLLSAVSLLASVLLGQLADNSYEVDVVFNFLFFAGKFGVSCFYTVIFILTHELFPTVLRSTASGSCGSIPKIGAMLAPYSRPLYAVAKWAPGTIFASMSFIGLLLTTLLPETKDRNLPTEIKDLDKGKRVREVNVDDERRSSDVSSALVRRERCKRTYNKGNGKLIYNT